MAKLVGKIACPHCKKITLVGVQAQDESSDSKYNVEHGKLDSPDVDRPEQQVSLPGFWVSVEYDICEHCGENVELDIDSNTPGIKVVP